MPAWSFLTNHARLLLYIAHDPGLRPADLEAADQRRGDPRGEMKTSTVNAGESDALRSNTIGVAGLAFHRG